MKQLKTKFYIFKNYLIYKIIMKQILGTMNIEYQYSSNSDNSIEYYKSIIDEYINCVPDPILDTAYYYGNTKTEQILGKILINYDKLPKIATKANSWYENDFTNGKFGQLCTDGLKNQLNISLLNLGLKKVDIFYLHCWDWETPIKETLEVTNEMWRKEKFDQFGISNFSKNQLKDVLNIIENEGYCSLSYYQGMYNMISRKIEETFDILSENNIEFWAYNPLAGGLLTGKYKSKIFDLNSRFKSNSIYQNIFWKEPILNEIEEFINIQNPTEYALNWYENCNKLKSSDGIIMGVSTLSQLKNNINLLKNKNIFDINVYKNFDRKYINFEKHSPNYYY